MGKPIGLLSLPTCGNMCKVALRKMMIDKKRTVGDLSNKRVPENVLINYYGKTL